MTIMGLLCNSISLASPAFIQPYTILPVNPTLPVTCSPTDLPIDAFWVTDASFKASVITTITASTLTVTVSAVSISASTSPATPVTTSVLVFAHPVTTLLPQRCMQPGGVPLACAQTPVDTILAPPTTTTLISGSVVAISQKSGAISLGAANLFKPIVAGFKSVLSLGVDSGKKFLGPVPAVYLDGNENLVACLSFAELTSINGTANATQKSTVISLGKNLFKPS
jgi:hypothetical protein